MRILAIAALAVLSLHGQTALTTIQSTDLIRDSRGVINSNFTTLHRKLVYCRSTTGNDTYTCTGVPTLAAYTRGNCVLLDADTANTGPATVNITTLGAKSILTHTGGALSDGDIPANKPVTACYDGTQYILQGGTGSGSGGGVAPVFTTLSFHASTMAPTCTSGAPSTTYQITLTGNVSTFTAPSGCSAGQKVTFEWVQNVSGGWTVSYPAAFEAPSAIDTTASKKTAQTFTYNGTTFVPDSPAAYTAVATPGIVLASGNVVLIPDANGTFATIAGTQTLTNKTVDGDDNTVQDLAYSAIKSTSRSGNGTKVATVTGSTTTDNCAKWDGNGNVVDAGAACGTGSGGGGSGIGRTSASVNFSSAIPDGGYDAKTFTWTGITTSDTVVLGPPASLAAGLHPSVVVTAANTVQVRLYNGSGAAITPGSLTFNATLSIVNLSGTSTLNFGSIADGATAVLTFSLTGVSAGDPVTAKLPAALESGLHVTMVASATDTIQVRALNVSGAAIDPASATFGASIFK